MPVEIIFDHQIFFSVTFAMLLAFLLGSAVGTAIDHKNTLITNVEEKNTELRHISEVDQLTGLYNRHRMDDFLENIKTREQLLGLTVMTLDVNGLKAVNDDKGHIYGDELIIRAANCIQDAFGKYGDCYRTGGDEFMVFMTGEVPSDNVLKNDFAHIVEKENQESRIEVSISLGIARGTDYTNLPLNELLKKSDEAMYADKANYYRRKGVDRRGQQVALKLLCDSYTKILKVDLSNDSYTIIRMDESEKNEGCGFDTSISKWLHDFAVSGCVHPEDKDNYIKNTALDYLRDYFSKDNKIFSISYRRKKADSYEPVMMEIIKAEDYEEERQNVFLYVKNITEVGRKA